MGYKERWEVLYSFIMDRVEQGYDEGLDTVKLENEESTIFKVYCSLIDKMDEISAECKTIKLRGN